VCHHLNVQDGQLKGYNLRQGENKKKVIQALQNLKFKVFASGDSYNDIQMLQEADFGVFFQAPSHIREEFLEIPGVESHEELKEVLIKQSSFVQIK
jgi:phosphoserine/homoserine phosphotransferase